MIHFPFTAIVGQEQMKLALALNAIAPEIGGVLIQGERGTAKSTVVRALAALLPEIPVVAGCELGCDPQAPAPFCAHCQGLGGEKETELRRAPLVELPLGAGEDRVLGHLDLGAALGHGLERFRPGLLFQAHRGVLYVDEVNLLADHLVDVLLDAAASGWHVVEREGFSVRHAARFVLVGTMNPEEGELRPQLLDRFGLGVAVGAPTDRAERLAVIERRMAFERDPEGFVQACAAAEAEERARIAQGRALLPQVEVPDEAREYLVTLCAESGVEGMRGDLVTYRAARALAAYRGRVDTTLEDVRIAAELALRHRGGTLPEPSPPRGGEGSGRGEESERAEEAQSPVLGEGESPKEPRRERVRAEGGRALPDRVAPILDARLSRRLSWRRLRAQEAAAGGGKHMRLRGGERGQWGTALAAPSRRAERIAWPESIARALLRTGARPGRSERPVLRLRQDDLRFALGEARARLLTLLLVDASGSMGAQRRMAVTKAAVLALVRRAYESRDRVAVITFRGQGASVLLPPTSSVTLARERLRSLPTGGRTPLFAGLSRARAFLREVRLRMPDYAPVLLVLSDGRANAAPPGASPYAAALEEAGRIRRDGGRAAVIDTSEGFVDLGFARQLAQALSAQCLPLGTLVALAEGEVSA